MLFNKAGDYIMKRLSYNEFKEAVKKEWVLIRSIVNRRAPRRRPRDLGETEALIMLAEKAWANSIARGKLLKKGSRLYSLKLDE